MMLAVIMLVKTGREMPGYKRDDPAKTLLLPLNSSE